jgi:hypothetical protein
MERRCVVDSVAQVADDVARLPERNDDALLLIRLDLGEDVDVGHLIQQGAIGQLVKFGAGEDSRARKADLELGEQQPEGIGSAARSQGVCTVTCKPSARLLARQSVRGRIEPNEQRRWREAPESRQRFERSSLRHVGTHVAGVRLP